MPARRWSEQDRDKVIRMVAEGESRQVIAKKLKTSVSSLRRHFGELLNHEVGQQPKEFTPQEKASAIAMASYGIAQREIADCLDVSLTCLRRHLGDDMTKAPTQANANVARALYRGATRDGSTKAQIFWLKSRAKWKDRVEIAGGIEVSGTVDHVHSFDLVGLVRQLSPEARGALKIVLQEVQTLRESALVESDALEIESIASGAP